MLDCGRTGCLPGEHPGDLFDPLVVVEDVRHSVRETKLHALGRTDGGRLLHVTFTLRDEGRLIRVISARTMHRKERVRYEQEA